MSAPIRVFIAGIRDAFYHRLRAMIVHAADMVFVGQTSNGLEAVAQVRRLMPDVALMSANLPVLGGFQVARRLTEASATTRILIFSPHNTEGAAWVAQQAGAHGLLDINAPEAEILAAIRAACKQATSDKGKETEC